MIVSKTKIPKKIHYCWFGPNPMPDYAIEFIEGWKKLSPEYEIIKWDESNFDVNAHPYTKSAYERGLYPFVADYARLAVINEYGGIYMDTDVEMIRPLDEFMSNTAFFALEDMDAINTGLIVGAVPRQKNIEELLTQYDKRGMNLMDGKFIMDTCVQITTSYFRRKGFKYVDKIQRVDESTIYPTSFFCPQKYGEWRPKITSSTHIIHHYYGNWSIGDETNRTRIYRNTRIGRKIKKVIGVNNFQRIYRVYQSLKK